MLEQKLTGSRPRLRARCCSMAPTETCNFKAGSLWRAATLGIMPVAPRCVNCCEDAVQARSIPRSLGVVFLRPNARKEKLYANHKFIRNFTNLRERADRGAVSGLSKSNSAADRSHVCMVDGVPMDRWSRGCLVHLSPNLGRG